MMTRFGGRDLAGVLERVDADDVAGEAARAVRRAGAELRQVAARDPREGHPVGAVRLPLDPEVPLTSKVSNT